MHIANTDSHANRNSQFYTHTDGHGYGNRYAYPHALRERAYPKRRV